MKKWMLYALAFILGLPQFLNAQVNFTGVVVNTQNQPLVGANVRLSEVGTQVTNLQGEFSFQNVKPGEYQLRVSYVGFKAYTEILSVGNGTNSLTIKLTEDAFLPEAVVTGATRATATTPMAYNTISKEELQKQNLGQDLPYLLNFTPSVVTTSDAGAGVGYTGIRVRGSDASRVNVTINGIPLNDSESHGVFWVNLPDLASSVDNIQLQRGVGTSTNGSGAFGASLIIQTDNVAPEAFAETSISAGSYNTQRYTVKAGTGLMNNRFAVDARLSKISSDGYIDRAFSNLKSFFVSGGYYGEKTLIKANVFSGKEQTYQSWWGTPEALVETDRTYNYYTYDNETDNYQQDHYQLIFGQELTEQIQLNLAGHYTYGRGYYEQFREDDDLAFYGLPTLTLGGETITSSDLIRRRWLDNDFYGFTYALAYEHDNRLDLTLGGAWNRYKGDHFGEVIRGQFVAEENLGDRYYNNEAIKNDFNIYLKGNYYLGQGLSLYGDVQYRYVEYSYGGIDHGNLPIYGEHDFNFLNPKVGVNYQADETLRFYASYAKGTREPVRGDFIDAPTGKLPQPEKLHDFELGSEIMLSRQVQLSVNGYLMNYTNQLVLTGELNDVGSSIRVNVPKSYRMGLEAQVGIQPIPEISIQANATISQNRIRSFIEPIYFYNDDFDAIIDEQQTNFKDSPISFSPWLIAGGIFTGKPVKGLELSLMPKYVSRQYLDNTGTESRSLEAYFITDFRANYTLTPDWINQIQLNILVNNIFSELYESNGYTYGYGYGGEVYYENYLYPQAPRNFLAGINIKF